MSSQKITLTPPRKSGWQLPALVLLLGLVWLLVWPQLQALADWFTYDLIGLLPETRLGESVNFFFYDVPKILMLLAGMIFLVTFVRSFFSPEQTRAALGGRREGVGNVLAAGFGCADAVLLLFGRAAVHRLCGKRYPAGRHLLIPDCHTVVNEIALAMLFGLFGWQIAGLYLVSGLTIAVVGGLIIGRLQPEKYVEEFVWQVKVGQTGDVTYKPTWDDRLRMAGRSTKEIVGKVWPFVILGIGMGAGIHGYVPEDLLAERDGARGVVVGASGRSPGRPAVCQRRWHHPGGACADGKRSRAGHGAGLHDVRRGAQPAGNADLEAGAQAAPHRHFCGHCSPGDYFYRLPV
jgi:uncharacterized membrane protein YraQ (UPF0718 family)